MEFEFADEVIYWRGPSPFHFLTVPAGASREIDELSGSVTYGWGMIPAAARTGTTEWTTSLWPKDGRYLLPVKAAVRRAEGIELGDVISVRLRIDEEPVSR